MNTSSILFTVKTTYGNFIASHISDNVFQLTGGTTHVVPVGSLLSVIAI